MNRIKELREELGVRQSWLANKLHVAQTAISKYELEERDPSISTIHKLCDIFNCTADYLLGRSKNRTNVVEEQDLDMLAAYHAAPYSVQSAITILLAPYIGDQKPAQQEGIKKNEAAS